MQGYAEEEREAEQPGQQRQRQQEYGPLGDERSQQWREQHDADVADATVTFTPARL